MVATLDAGAHFQTIGHIGVIAGLLDDGGVIRSIAYAYMNRFAVRQRYGHLRWHFTACEPQCCGNGGSGSAGPCGEAAVQREKLRQKPFHSPAQAVGTVDMFHRAIAGRIGRAFDDKNFYPCRLSRFHLLCETTARAAFLGDDCLWAQLPEQGGSVVVLIITEMVVGKTLFCGQLS